MISCSSIGAWASHTAWHPHPPEKRNIKNKLQYLLTSPSPCKSQSKELNKKRGDLDIGLLFDCYSIAHLTTGTVVPSEVPPAGTFVCREVLGVFLEKKINV